MRDNERKRAHTMLNQPTLPLGFNFGNFIHGLTMLDINLNNTLKQLDAAINANNEEEITRLSVEKQKRTEALMRFLAQAYFDTNGEIAKMSEFDPLSDRSFNLSLEEKGPELWEKVMERVAKVIEDARTRAEQVMIIE